MPSPKPPGAASLTAMAAYAVGLVIVLTAIPMLIIANAYRRLNLWNANCGASFEWVGRAISTAVILVMLVIAVAGIRLTARTQVGMAAIEYVILIGFAITGFIVVLGHHHGTFPITRGWFSISGIGGKGSLAAGFLIAVFMYTGWDATVYVNEEVANRRASPGRAAIMAVTLLAIIFTVSEMGLAGAVSPAKLQTNSSSSLVYCRPRPGRRSGR